MSMDSVLANHIARLRGLSAELDIEADHYAEQMGALAPQTPAPPSPAAVVRGGQARVAVLLALGDLAGAMGRLEALAVGIARALDATAKPTEGP